MMGAGPRPSPAQGIAAAAVMLAVGAYPFAADAALTRWGVRAVASGVLLLGALTLVARVLLDRRRALRTALEHGGALLLAALALVTGAVFWLQLLPVLVNATLCVAFLASLREGESIVETVARWIEPFLPDFTGSYCRAVTVFWSGFFALAAAGIAVVALVEPRLWRTAAVPVYFGVVAILSLAEFVFRKLWFRHYTSRPIDRLFARLFPPDRTARGRRSEAYIDRMRELGHHID